MTGSGPKIVTALPAHSITTCQGVYLISILCACGHRHRVCFHGKSPFYFRIEHYLTNPKNILKMKNDSDFYRQSEEYN
jgi:hypothetical protein